MQTTLENKKKAATNSPRNDLKKKNIVEEKGVSSLGVKREHDSIDVRALKMMRGRVEPSTMPIVVHATRHTTKVPQMTSPHERHLKEHRQEVSQMMSP
jgi:hypothetical protein